MGMYRKKPVVIEAIQFTGNNYDEMDKFFGESKKEFGYQCNFKGELQIVIENLKDFMYGSVNDFIIKDVNGEFYLYKPDIFEKTYERDYSNDMCPHNLDWDYCPDCCH